MSLLFRLLVLFFFFRKAIAFIALFEEEITWNGIDDQNNDNIIDESQDMLKEQSNNLILSQNMALFLQFCC